MKIGVIDYGMGNLYSVEQALLRLGCEVTITSNQDILNEMDGYLLPGVGAFPDAMQRLNELGLADYIKELATAKKPLLGICLGMQLLYVQSNENGNTKGLGLLKGDIQRFNELDSLQKKVRIPHMGWNPLSFVHQPDWLHDLANEESTHVYFVHSYLAQNTKQSEVLASSTYAGQFVPGLVQKESIMGMQFHPEKSGTFGKYLLKQWVQFVKEKEN
ncbi:MAG: imidazole glycerol phosphate synthase subunit HisH [Paenisporosarcina sp.]